MVTRSIKYENFAIYEACIGTVSGIFTEIYQTLIKLFLLAVVTGSAAEAPPTRRFLYLAGHDYSSHQSITCS